MADSSVAITALQKYRQSDKYREWLVQYRAKNKARLTENTKRYRNKPGNKEKENIKQIEYRQKIKQMIFDHYGSACACCFEDNIAFLSIDHVNNDGYLDKSNARRAGGRNLYNKVIKEGYPNNYQVLCMNCNHAKARNGGICPHKTERRNN